MQSQRLIRIYACLADETRLRILNLLDDGPLCVNHFQEILEVTQVNVSKHLAYLRTRGMVEARRHRNMMIYHLPLAATPEIEHNLVCLRECLRTIPSFSKEKEKLRRFQAKNGWLVDVVKNYGLPGSRQEMEASPKKSRGREVKISA